MVKDKVKNQKFFRYNLKSEISNSFWQGFVFCFLILISLGLVIGVGFHTAEEILPGTFTGNYVFNGSISLEDGDLRKSELTSNGLDIYGYNYSDLSKSFNLHGFDAPYNYIGIQTGVSSDGTKRDLLIGVGRHPDWNSHQLFLSRNGNVGIGNGNPIAKLSVSGNITAEAICDETGNNCNDLSEGISSSMTCPSGFTLIESQGRQLGCMQNDEKGDSTWPAAAADCWNTYGGRLPFGIEFHLAMDNYDLNGEIDDWEWISDIPGSNDARAVIGGGGLHKSSYGNQFSPTHIYRCFIPN